MVNDSRGQRLYYGWVVVFGCLLSVLIIFGIRYSYGVFFKSLEQGFGWNRTMTSGLFSTYMILCCVFAILGGWALDRYGPRIVFALMGLFTGLSLFLSSRADAQWQLFVCFSLLLAVGTGPAYAVAMATASRWFIRRRGLALAVVGSGGGLGIIVMNPVAAWLVCGYGWQNAYLAMAVMALFIILPTSLLLRKAPDAKYGMPREEAHEASEPDRGASGKVPEDLSLLQAARSEDFWLLFFVWFFYSFCLHLVLTHLVPHAVDLGLSTFRAAAVVTLLGGTSILGRVIGGRVSDAFGKKRTAVICGLIMAGSMLLPATASGVGSLYLFALIFGLSYGGIDPPITALIGNVFGLRHIGIIMGVLGIGWSAGAAVGPALAGYLFDTAGSYFRAFLSGMVAMLLVVGMTLPLRASQHLR